MIGAVGQEKLHGRCSIAFYPVNGSVNFLSRIHENLFFNGICLYRMFIGQSPGFFHEFDELVVGRFFFLHQLVVRDMYFYLIFGDGNIDPVGFLGIFFVFVYLRIARDLKTVWIIIGKLPVDFGREPDPEISAWFWRVAFLACSKYQDYKYVFPVFHLCGPVRRTQKIVIY